MSFIQSLREETQIMICSCDGAEACRGNVQWLPWQQGRRVLVNWMTSSLDSWASCKQLLMLSPNINVVHIVRIF